MKALVNRFFFSENNLDSSSLGVLTSIAHRFTEDGAFYATVLRGSEAVGRFSILVGESPIEATATVEVQQQQQQVQVDLKALDLSAGQQVEDKNQNRFRLKREGYALLYVSTGAGGYAVQIHKAEKDGSRASVFDSRKLKDDDLFVATVLRPGTYSITNATTDARAELTVMYPEVGRIPRSPQPVSLECSRQSITPSKMKISPTQPLVFSFNVPSRIKIELVKPEDRPRFVKPVDKAVARIAKTGKQEAVPHTANKMLRRIRFGLSRTVQPESQR